MLCKIDILLKLRNEISFSRDIILKKSFVYDKITGAVQKKHTNRKKTIIFTRRGMEELNAKKPCAQIVGFRVCKKRIF